MRRLAREDGQTMVMAAVFMVALVGLAGMVLDVGSWFRQQRVTQSTVDAAALAGAQALPTDPGQAQTLATTYANDNGGSSGMTVTVSDHYTTSDQITVDQSKPADGFFSKLFGISLVTVHASATAITEIPTEVTGAAPIVVDIHHPMLSGPGCPCFNVPTTIPLGKKGTPGAFGLVDLNQNDNGNAGTSTLAGWIDNGYDNYLPLGDYDSDPGAHFDSSQIQDALNAKYGQDLLFPVYDSLTGQGSNAQYHIIGWASFHLTLTQASGNSGTLSGYFDKVIWDGVIPTSASGDSNIPNLGVYSVALTQ